MLHHATVDALDFFFLRPPYRISRILLRRRFKYASMHFTDSGADLTF